MLKKMIKKFLVVATTDPELRIWVTMLKHMNKQFDSYFAVKENLLMLFNCMNDSNLTIWDWTLKILGRMIDHNWPMIYPYLRKLLV